MSSFLVQEGFKVKKVRLSVNKKGSFKLFIYPKSNQAICN